MPGAFGAELERKGACSPLSRWRVCILMALNIAFHDWLWGGILLFLVGSFLATAEVIGSYILYGCSEWEVARMLHVVPHSFAVCVECLSQLGRPGQ